MKKIYLERLDFIRCKLGARIFCSFLTKAVFLRFLFALSVCYLAVLSSVVYAGLEWAANGEAICTAANNQALPRIVSDGAGGAIITWEDFRSGAEGIYAQRINTNGVVQWTANGVAICSASIHDIVSDGAGGAIITWEDYRSGTYPDIYAQRINANGVVQWTANGVAISTAENTQWFPRIASDGAGGAIITWWDNRSGTDFDIYAQRINANGVVQWTANGVAICAAANDQGFPRIASDGAGGATITWEDQRSGTSDIYAQRINANGAVQWTTNGQAICTAADMQSFPYIASDGAGGAIIIWDDYRSDPDGDIYAQRINANGVVQWTANGVAICTASGGQGIADIVSDGAGGAIITFLVAADGGTYSDIYAQRINANGVVQWTANGVAICTAANDQWYPRTVSDGAGGAIITWEDHRSDPNWDIYAQRINANGAVQWTANGEAVCKAANEQYIPTIESDGAGGAIITWYDGRSGTNWDIYAQRISTRPPQVVSITPDSGTNAGPIDITDLAGSNFLYSAVAKLTKAGFPDIQATNVVVVAPTKITCTFDLTGKETGKWSVVVTNGDGQSGALSDGFEIKEVPPNNAPTLSWTGETNYTSDGLNPEAAPSNTDFVYRVKYTDQDNDAPASGYPKVHIKKAGSEISGSPFAMGEVNAGDKTYSDGKLYTYTKSGLAPGTDYTYYFEAKDLWDALATGEPTSPVDAPDVTNNAPILSWTGETNYTSDGLEPEAALSNTDFVYRVKYTDQDNDAPASGYPKVHIKKAGSEISGSPFAMGEVDAGDKTYSDGKLYTYTKSGLAPGTDYTYYFEAKDLWDALATGEPTSPVDGPDVTPGPILEVSMLSFQFGEIPKPASETTKFTISNSGGGTLEGTITADRPWISIKPTSFNSNNVTVSVTVYTDTLEVWKTYTGTVTIDSNGGAKEIDISILPTCVKSYPNPYSLSSGKPLTFWGTGVAYGTIKVYTLSGELVKTLKETNGEDKITWDGRNENGERIVRGIYFFTAQNPKERNTGKFTVVK